MSRSSGGIFDAWRVLVADDEPDVLAVTRLSLRGFKRQERGIELLAANSGKQAVETMRENPDVAVILLDVVMENDHAGLDACRAIRDELGNKLVRILLRTGQPGAAPERQTIDTYDIDGYLPKAELTSGRLYSAVRAALKSYGDLVDLDRHRKQLAAVHDCVMAFHSYLPLEDALRRVLDTVVAIAPCPLAVLYLETLDAQGDAHRHFMHLTTAPDPVRAEAGAQDIRARVSRAMTVGGMREEGPFEEGWLVPLVVPRELGRGWMYVQTEPELTARRSLDVLGAHAANAVYSTVTEGILRAQRGPVFDTLDV